MSFERENKTSLMPVFEAGKVFRQTTNFRIVMDYKYGLEDLPQGQRFFIQPLTDDAEKMLMMAAEMHCVPSISHREVEFGGKITPRACLRADFIEENIEPLFFGVTEVPQEGLDTIPSPDRMEECLAFHKHYYSFKD